jgi:hypothetical protein
VAPPLCFIFFRRGRGWVIFDRVSLKKAMLRKGLPPYDPNRDC